MFRALFVSAIFIVAGFHTSAFAEQSAAEIAALAHGQDSKTKKQLEGVRPPKIQGLVQSEGYSGLCVWKCLVFLGPDGDDKPGYPAIVVHQPFPVDAETMLEAYIAAENRPEGDRVTEQGKRKSVASHPRYRSILQFMRKDDDGDPVYVTALEDNGVTVLVELFAFRDRDIARRTKAYAAFVARLVLDREEIAAGAARRTTATNEAEKAVSDGFAAGEEVRVYTRVALRYGLTGVMIDGISQFGLRAERDVLVLLPGGVALEDLPNKPLADLSLRHVFGADAPTLWSEKGGAITLIRSDGSRKLLRKDGGGRLADPDGDGSWSATPELSEAELAGDYSFFEFVHWEGSDSSSGVASSGGRLMLRADGRYALKTTRSGSSGNADATVLSRRASNEQGRWSFDPASYTLWLAPNGARRYGVPAVMLGKSACRDGKCLWLISDETWKRAE